MQKTYCTHYTFDSLDTFAKPIRRIDRFMTNVLQVQRVADTINCENCRYTYGWTHGERSVACSSSSLVAGIAYVMQPRTRRARALRAMSICSIRVVLIQSNIQIGYVVIKLHRKEKEKEKEITLIK